ncbi:MAG: hypothetical protein CMJ64_08865 [Planctomycetaceae bacterium]|nr:hypothetical protein [Planctomycetaceae bacterium]
MSFISQFIAFLMTPFRWLLSLPMWIVSTPRRVMGLSLPARAALFVAIVLLGLVLTVVISVALNPDGLAELGAYVMRPLFYLALGLSIVIPIIVFFWLRLWLEGDVSRFPDIDEAWNEGLAALQEQSLDIGSAPLFLVLGLPDEKTCKSLFAASGMDLMVRDVPQGRPPLRWYADENAVYLVCLDSARLSKLHTFGGNVGRPSPGQSEIRSTMQPSGDVRGTMVAGGSIRDSAAPAADYDDAPDAGAMIRGTLIPGAAAGGGGASAPAPSSGSSMLSRQDAENQTERLEYVCELLSRARTPVCPLNGVLVAVPLRSVQSVMIAKDIPGAARSDLDTIRNVTKLRAPVTVMVAGMEAESGFCELVRRVGTTKAKANRFGKGFNVWNPPTEENMDAFSSHACGAFEDWVYSLFREREGLSKPGNAKLYTLLCKIRSQLRARLRSVLLHGFSFSHGDKKKEDIPLLFNGCYFTATGDTPDRQAFVKNVFEKMIDLEEELEWMPEAIREDDRYHQLAQIGMFIDAVLVLGIVGMLVWKLFYA